MSKFKKFTLSLIVLGLVTSFVTVGTFASFSAETTNPGNSFSSGTLVLSSTKQGGTTCYSTGTQTGATDSNVNGACEVILNPTAKKPGDSSIVNMTLKNEGSINASTLKVFSTACAASNSTDPNHGAGDPCTILQVYVQQFSDAAFMTPSKCLYGNTGATCNFSDPSKTLNDFKSAYTASAGLLIAPLTAGNSAYVAIGVMLPSSAGNAFQGRTATFDFNWLLEQ